MTVFELLQFVCGVELTKTYACEANYRTTSFPFFFISHMSQSLSLIVT